MEELSVWTWPFASTRGHFVFSSAASHYARRWFFGAEYATAPKIDFRVTLGSYLNTGTDPRSADQLPAPYTPDLHDKVILKQKTVIQTVMRAGNCL